VVTSSKRGVAVNRQAPVLRIRICIHSLLNPVPRPLCRARPEGPQQGGGRPLPPLPLSSTQNTNANAPPGHQTPAPKPLMRSPNS
jgi:hypothetical protein